MSQTQAQDFCLDIESEGFTQQQARIQTGRRRLNFSWGDLLWAALTVGRPNLSAVFQFGDDSFHEAVMRLSMVRMALRNRPSLLIGHLERTDAFLSLDPTEKGAINYFLGMALCKMVSERLLLTPWLMHVDAVRQHIPMRFMKGRSRPDLIGQDAAQRDWFSYECKGRTSQPSPQDKTNAKQQACRIISVNGARCALSIGAFSFFRKGRLEFYWVDPTDEPLEAIEIKDAKIDWRYHFEPVMGLLRGAGAELSSFPSFGHSRKIEDFDIEISLHPEIAPALYNEDYDKARGQILEIREELVGTDYHLDGIIVKTGPSWTKPFR